MPRHHICSCTYSCGCLDTSQHFKFENLYCCGCDGHTLVVMLCTYLYFVTQIHVFCYTNIICIILYLCFGVFVSRFKFIEQGLWWAELAGVDAARIFIASICEQTHSRPFSSVSTSSSSSSTSSSSSSSPVLGYFPALLQICNISRMVIGGRDLTSFAKVENKWQMQKCKSLNRSN